MPKAIKITPCSIEEVEDWKTDQDYINNTAGAFCLNVPTTWKHKKYNLSVIILDKFEHYHEFNALATKVFQALKCSYGPVEELVFGFMFICNEDEEDLIHFTLDDFK